MEVGCENVTFAELVKLCGVVHTENCWMSTDYATKFVICLANLDKEDTFILVKTNGWAL